MPDTRQRGDVSVVIVDVIEQVFATVDEVRRLALDRHAAASTQGRSLADADISGMAPELLALMRRPEEVASGLGLILEPGLLPTRRLRLEWWQWTDGRQDPRPLEVDLHPDSVNFYDYAATEWFATPRRTRQRHIVGPYVDVHGTDRYLLTLTMPVEVDGKFLGVAGADLSITRFETLVLGRLQPGDEAVVVNDEGRVVLSTSSRWITGSLLGKNDRLPGRPLPQLPWLLLQPPGQSAGGSST